jgi:cysteine desulfurase / selenocysteine lyase
MSTSDRDNIGNAGESHRLNRIDAMDVPSAGGLPDVAAIARLANEFFRALPGESASPLAG